MSRHYDSSSSPDMGIVANCAYINDPLGRYYGVLVQVFTLEMMLKMMNIDPNLIGFDADRQCWTD